MWDDTFRPQEEEAYDKKFKADKMKEIALLKLEDKQHYLNLHETYNDAQMMYDFMSDNICTDLSDITIMSSLRDFHRVY